MATVAPLGSKRGGAFFSDRSLWWLMTVPALLSGAWGVYISFFWESLGAHYERMFAVPFLAFLHTFGGGLASLIGPFQFHKGLRRRQPVWHRQAGRVYLIAVGLSSLAALYISPNSLAANTFGVAFIALALAWLYTGWNAYATARARDFQAHRRWMIRNFALTYAAVTLRVQMPLLVAGGMDSVLALNVTGVTCWVPNLIFAEWYMRRDNKARWRA